MRKNRCSRRFLPPAVVTAGLLVVTVALGSISTGQAGTDPVQRVASSASEAGNPPPGVVGHREPAQGNRTFGLKWTGYVELVAVNPRQVDFDTVAGYCPATEPGGGNTCSTTLTHTVSSEISSGAQVTAGLASATIGQSTSREDSWSTLQTSPPLRPGQVFVAHPYRTEYRIRLVRTSVGPVAGPSSPRPLTPPEYGPVTSVFVYDGNLKTFIR